MKLRPTFNRSTTRRLTEAVHEGVGLREHAWPLPQRLESGATGMASEIVAWVREVMGNMRRPYGIDQVALALACRDAEGRVVCSNSLGILRPATFYTDEGQALVEAFLEDARIAEPGEGAKVVGALLSLGDVAYELGVTPRAA